MSTNHQHIPASVQWHEGMLLGPQHFQQSFLRQELLLGHHIMNLAPNYWGIEKLEINRGLLVSGYFQVDELVAVMPDGLFVNYVSSEKNKLEVDLNQYRDEIRKKDLTVYLAVAVQKPENIVEKGEISRYRSLKGDLVNDANTGDNPVLIPRLVPALNLIVVDELSSKYVGFPLAVITHKDANFMMTDYIPPGISLSALPAVREIGDRIVQQLREKANYLSEKIKAVSSSTGMAMILETKEMIRSVVSALPQFEIILRSPGFHPFLLYHACTVLAGHLAFLDSEFIPPIFEPYDHNNLRAIFTTVHEYIHRVTEQGIQEKYTCFSFSYQSEIHGFGIMLEEAWFSEEMIVGVRGQPGMSLRDVEEWFSKCIIGSESLLPSMRERRVSGIKRKPIEGNENLVPLRGVQLFSLTMDRNYVNTNERLFVINPANHISGTRRADEIVLYVPSERIIREAPVKREDEEGDDKGGEDALSPAS